MKIGILTLPLHTNYGGILQAYALQTVLERMGHEVIVLNRDRNVYIPKHKQLVLYAKYLIRKYCLWRNTSYKSPRKKNIERTEKEKYTSGFISKHIHSLYYRSFDDVDFKKFDAIVVGSDQVWSPIHGKNLCGSVINAFLPFTKDLKIKRIAYAASFGKDYWEYSEEETERAKLLIRSFDSISVRENSGVEFCEKYLSAHAIQTLDPTLLLDSKDYISLILSTEIIHKKNSLLVYVIDNTKDKSYIVDYVANSSNLIPNIVNSRAEDRSGKKFELKEMIQPPVELWLSGFMDASCIVTDSFHACVFSILFKKEFIAIGNQERGLARFHNLLSSLGLEERLVLDSSEVTDELIHSKIDYKTVYEKLDKMRKHSMNFLTKSLS